MTDIATQAQEDHTLVLEVTVRTEFPIGITSFKKTDLEKWLSKLPDEARISYEGIRSGKIMMVSTWKERRNA